MEITKEIKNDLLKRKEVEASVNSMGNPGTDSITKSLSSHFKTDEENIKINTIKNKYGTNMFDVRAYIYESLEIKKKMEPVKKVKKAAEGEKK